jgi:hypothetical protein
MRSYRANMRDLKWPLADSSFAAITRRASRSGLPRRRRRWCCRPRTSLRP